MDNSELILDEDLFSKLVDFLKSKGRSYNTVVNYSNTMRRFFKKYKVLNQKTLRSILKEIKHQNQRAVLSLIKNYCDYIGNGFTFVIPSVKQKHRKLPKLVTIEQVKIMIKSAPAPYDLMLRCIFNMGSGLRISEAIKLSWNHIRWPDWIADKNHYGIALIRSGKGDKDRVVNIPKNLMSDLYEYAKSKGVLNEFGIPVGNMIFKVGKLHKFKPELFASNRERWKQEYIKQASDWFRYNIINKHCKKAIGLPKGEKFTVHHLRHVKSTYLYEVEKIPIERIQQLLGHSDISTTLIYTKVNPISTFDLIKDTEEV